MFLVHYLVGVITFWALCATYAYGKDHGRKELEKRWGKLENAKEKNDIGCEWKLLRMQQKSR